MNVVMVLVAILQLIVDIVNDGWGLIFALELEIQFLNFHFCDLLDEGPEIIGLLIGNAVDVV